MLGRKPVLLGMGLLLLDGAASAQPGRGRDGGGWGPQGAYQRLYDPKTVETVRGSVLAVDTFSVAPGGRTGVHLRLLSGKDTVPVHLGPQWFLDNQEMHVAQGDTVQVKGSKVDFGGKPAMIAAEVRKGDEVLTLRDAKGYPAWSGWRRRK